MRYLTSGILLAASLAFPPQTLLADDTPPDFGNSVRHMVDQQIYDRKNASNPPAEPPLTHDGERAAAAVKEYRRPQARSSGPMATEMPGSVSANP